MFEWEDIAGKVLFVAYRDDDMVTAITEEGQEYLLEFGKLDTREKQQEILECFLGESTDIDENTDLRDFRETERWLYKWLPFAYIYVRKDFFDKFSSEFEKQSVKRYLTALDTVRKMLNPQGEFPRMVIRQQRQYGKWEALTFEQQRLKEIDDIFKKNEQEFDEFANIQAAKLREFNETEEPVILPFEWEDITDEVLKKVVFVEFRRINTILPGYVIAVTEEGLEYFAESEDYKEDDIRELFLGENTELDDRYAVPEDTKDFRAMGKWLYKRTSALQIFVRKDFFDRFVSVYEKRTDDHFSEMRTVRELLNPQGKLPRMIPSQHRHYGIGKEVSVRRKTDNGIIEKIKSMCLILIPESE